MTPEQADRYARQIRLPEVGEDGQAALVSASVLVVGAGGLGAPALHLLAAAGVGRIGISEFDRVDVSNLHRQTLYSTDDVGRPKIDAAEGRLNRINPEIEVCRHPGRLTSDNAADLLAGYDLVVDGSDTFSTRYAVNEASVEARTPNVFASVDRFEGLASVFGAEGGPCYRCVFPSPPPPGEVPSCEEGGVLGVVPGLMGTVQATEALKLLLGVGRPLVGRLLRYDALSMRTSELAVERDPDCPTCGDGTSSRPPVATEISPADLRRRLASPLPPALLDVRTSEERAGGHIGGTWIPIKELEGRADELLKGRNRPVVVYCASGVRSAAAAAALSALGFEALSLAGGLAAWRADHGRE